MIFNEFILCKTNMQGSTSSQQLDNITLEVEISNSGHDFVSNHLEHRADTNGSYYPTKE